MLSLSIKKLNQLEPKDRRDWRGGLGVSRANERVINTDFRPTVGDRKIQKNGSISNRETSMSDSYRTVSMSSQRVAVKGGALDSVVAAEANLTQNRHR